jgi:hypothetical protein
LAAGPPPGDNQIVDAALEVSGLRAHVAVSDIDGKPVGALEQIGIELPSAM